MVPVPVLDSRLVESLVAIRDARQFHGWLKACPRIDRGYCGNATLLLDPYPSGPHAVRCGNKKTLEAENRADRSVGGTGVGAVCTTCVAESRNYGFVDLVQGSRDPTLT